MMLYSERSSQDVALDVQPSLGENYDWEILPKTVLMLNQVKPTAEMTVFLLLLKCQRQNSGMKTVVKKDISQSQWNAHKETSVR